jgi:hypothetical protein
MGGNVLMKFVKSWYLSKTLWINALALAAVILQAATGKEVFSVESQGIALTVINIVLRLVTKHELK